MSRRTDARISIALELLRKRDSARWGYELSHESGVGPGSMYPFLRDLLADGHLEDGWEEQVPGGRPPRRYYRLTEDGAKALNDFVATSPQRSPRDRRQRKTRVQPADPCGPGVEGVLS
jgi:DNA-binding PadR family transcriptional regulator